MRVLINALGANMGGAMRHLTNFLPALSRYDQSNAYVVLLRASVSKRFELGENIHVCGLPDRIAGGMLPRIIHDVLWLPAKVRARRFDVTVSLTNFGPVWLGIPHILFQRDSNYYSQLTPLRRTLNTSMRLSLLSAAMRRAAIIVTPSDGMAQMIRQAVPSVSRKCFRTLYHGFSLDSIADPIDPKYSARIRTSGLRLLYPTHAARHKGFEILFKALSLLKQRSLDFTFYTTADDSDCPEVVAGYRRQIAQLGIEHDCVLLGSVPQREMGALYSAVDLMVYPSLAESFGFSMVEAMSRGLAIVASDTEVNREMCQDAALYYSPLDHEAAAAAIQQASDPITRQRLSEAGLRRMSTFDWSWDRYAREFCALVRTAVQ